MQLHFSQLGSKLTFSDDVYLSAKDVEEEAKAKPKDETMTKKNCTFLNTFLWPSLSLESVGSNWMALRQSQQ